MLQKHTFDINKIEDYIKVVRNGKYRNRIGKKQNNFDLNDVQENTAVY